MISWSHHLRFQLACSVHCTRYSPTSSALTPSLPPSQINAILLGYHLSWRALTVATNITSAHVSTVPSSQITPYIQDQTEASLSPLKVLLFSSHASCPPAIMKYFPLSKQDNFFLWELLVRCLNNSCSGHACPLSLEAPPGVSLFLWRVGSSRREVQILLVSKTRHLAHSKHIIFLLSWISRFEITWKEKILISTMTSLFFLDRCEPMSKMFKTRHLQGRQKAFITLIQEPLGKVPNLLLS